VASVLDCPPVLVVVQQHVEEGAHLRNVRTVLVRAPHVRLKHLRRLDDRIAAHLDGLAVAGEYGTALCRAALARAGVGEVFAFAVRALEDRDDTALDRAIALAAALPDARRGLLSAIGWVSAAQLRGIAQSLLSSAEPLRRELGLAACRLHGVDPGVALASALRSDDPLLRAAAARAAGELGRSDLLEEVLAATASPDPALALHAAAAGCLLGDRGVALRTLEQLAMADGPDAALADPWLFLATRFERGRELLRDIAHREPRDAMLERRVTRASGLLGDTRLVPWLIERMDDDAKARLAGEAFSLITGADLAALDLERKPPATIPAGPNDDPDDTNVALDEDDSLPWPDRTLIERWWAAHAGAMPLDAGCFMGGAPTPARVADVLRTGFQRQRHAAARLRCLLEPRTPLFPTCAPSWRQSRLLAQ
jgi:uncharacterized protein (TIGR02270 family)